MTDPWYRVQIVAGAYSWDVTAGDAPAYGPTSQLRFGWSMPDGDLWPSQPSPATAAFGLVAASTTDLATLDVGDPVAIRVWTDPATVDFTPEACPYSFYGRVSELESDPLADGRVLYAVQATDYTGPELVGRAVGPYKGIDQIGGPPESPWDNAGTTDPISGNPGGTYFARVLTILEDAGLPTVAGFLTALEAYASEVTIDPTEAADLVRGYLPYLMTGTPDAPAGYVLTPYATDTGPGRLDGTRYALDPVTKTNPAAALPMVLAELTPGVWSVAPDPAGSPAVGLVDACRVDLAATYRRSIDRSTNLVTIVGAYQTGDGTEHLPTTLAVASTVTGALSAVILEPPDQITIGGYRPGGGGDYATTMGALYLTDPGDRWTDDGFRFHLWADPAGFPPAFPNHADPTDPATGDRADLYSVPVVLTGIPEHQSPNGSPWMAGRLVGADFTLDAGSSTTPARFYIDFRLDAARPAPTAAGTALTWADLAADPATAGVTWANLDPRDSWADYRLLKGAP